MIVAVKAGWLTGHSDLWGSRHTSVYFCLLMSLKNKGEQKQLVTEEIKRGADNAGLCLFLMPVGGGQRTCVARFLLLGATEIICAVFCSRL